MELCMPTDSTAIGNLIFLSYRRADTAAQTLALKLELENNLCDVQVFMDNRAITAGDRFPEEIDDALRRSTTFVAVIGKTWLGLEAGGNRRIDDPGDWVFKEISFALENKVSAFIPILIDDTPPLVINELPQGLQELSTLQGIRVAISDWESSVNQLIRLLEQKFKFRRKQKTYEYPIPNTAKAHAPQYSFKDLQEELRVNLRAWTLEYSNDPERTYYKFVDLRRDFKFDDYENAIEFVNLIAQRSKDEDHHPQFLVVWRTVSVWTSTWDAGHRITSYDVAFARYLERNYKPDFRLPRK
jgi:pterin-4a-carbinolamine dehydratase